MSKPRFRIGSKVRVKGQRRMAIIWDFYSHVKGGVILDRLISGFRSWNVEDLRPWRSRRKHAD